MELQIADPKTLRLNPDNPRRTKAAPELDAQLTANIKAIGVIQPPLVCAVDGGLEVIAGERRVRCAIAAGLRELHVLVSTEADGNDPLRSLAENTQRAQMNPVDQWRAIEALCGSGWGEEAIATAFSMSARTIRKLRLLGRIHPKMLDRMAFDMPCENDLRKIAAAPLEEQAAAWKRLKPKRGEEMHWYEIVRALDRRRISARMAAFDDDAAINFGVVWEEDLFGSAGEDNRFTTNVEAFFAAQHHWLEENLPENGVILDSNEYGQPRLPPKAERRWGEPEEGDNIGFSIDPRTGGIDKTVFRLHAPEKSVRGGGGKQCEPIANPVERPDITKKGIEQIGDFRTEALHRGLQEAEFDDAALIGLLVLALAAENVEVRGDTGSCASRARVAATITEGGALTSDLAILRQAGRDMLRQVLNCSKGWHGSGLVARIAGETIGADQYLPNMADDKFLKTLSKAGIQRTARESGVPVLPQTAKEIRAALLRHVGQGRFVLPQARFALTEAEVAARDAAKNVESGSSDIGLDDWEESFPEQESNEADIAFHSAAA